MDIKKNEIIGQSRHQFIYGYDGEQRTKLLKEIEEENPIVINGNSPMAVYISDYGLPQMVYDKKKVDNGLITIVSTGYFTFSVLSHIIEAYSDNVKSDEKNDAILKLMNQYYNLNLSGIEDLKKVFNDSKTFYKNYYTDYLKNGSTSYSIEDVQLPFVDLLMFLSQFKKIINNDSYFAFLIDNNKEISIPSTKVINYYVGSRINDTISVKIATDADKWKSYLDCNGEFIQSCHDYGYVQLDDSLKKVLKKSYKIV